MASWGHMHTPQSIIVDRAIILGLMGRIASPPSPAARDQQSLWLMGPQDGEKAVSNSGRHWADHRHSNTILHCETSKSFGARGTWV